MNIGLCSQPCSLCLPIVVNLTPTSSRWNCSSWNKRDCLKSLTLFLMDWCIHLWMHMFKASFIFFINNSIWFYIVCRCFATKWSTDFGKLKRMSSPSLLPLPWWCQSLFPACFVICLHFISHGCPELYLTFWVTNSQDYGINRIFTPNRKK